MSIFQRYNKYWNSINKISLSCSYLNKGLVEKLEVVDKKWVRVKLVPGQTVEGSVSEIGYSCNGCGSIVHSYNCAVLNIT